MVYMCIEALNSLRGKMCFRAWTSSLLLVGLVALVQGQIEKEHKPCATPGGLPGKCVPVRECQYVRDILRRDMFFATETSYLNAFRCGMQPDGHLMVCCPRLQNAPNCGPLDVVVRIIGGNDTDIGEFPWMVLLRFEARNKKIHANCGASLISSRFVLTAAHCMISAKKKGWKLHSVRVAEWNYRNHRGNRDCKKLDYIDEPICRKDYDVARFSIHPEYRVNHAVHIHDIALIELVTDVQLNTFVAPICLPLAGVVGASPNSSHETVEYTAAGWGSISTGSGMHYKLMQVNLKPFDHDRCKRLFEVSSGLGICEAHVCAGGTEGEDTCHGDSGGPLMKQIGGSWYQQGITSFGWPKCGREGIPGVYTNISHYLGWLEYEMFRGVSV